VTIEESIRTAVAAELAPLRAEVARLAYQLEAMQRDTSDQYLSIQKAAAMAEVHPDTIRSWVKSGRLTEYRAGRELRILRGDLCRCLAGESTSGNRDTAEEEAAAILARRRAP
jgi:excisionase family DNA binding protein